MSGWRFRALKNTTPFKEREANRGGILATDFRGFKASILLTRTYVDFLANSPKSMNFYNQRYRQGLTRLWPVWRFPVCSAWNGGT